MKSKQKGNAGVLPMVLCSVLFLCVGLFVLSLREKTPAMETAQSGSFNVERLFTHEGCSVYRFKDAGYFRYYSKCSASTLGDVSYSYSESCGKNCTTTIESAVVTSYDSEVPYVEVNKLSVNNDRIPIPPTE